MNEEVDVVNDEDNDIPFWPTADDYEHRDHNESSPEIEQYLDQRLLQLENLQGSHCSCNVTDGRFTAGF